MILMISTLKNNYSTHIYKRNKISNFILFSIFDSDSSDDTEEDSQENLLEDGSEGKILSRNKVNGEYKRAPLSSASTIDTIDRITDGRDLIEIWRSFQKQEIKGKLFFSVFTCLYLSPPLSLCPSLTLSLSLFLTLFFFSLLLIFLLIYLCLYVTLTLLSSLSVLLSISMVLSQPLFSFVVYLTR